MAPSTRLATGTTTRVSYNQDNPRTNTARGRPPNAPGNARNGTSGTQRPARVDPPPAGPSNRIQNATAATNEGHPPGPDATTNRGNTTRPRDTRSRSRSPDGPGEPVDDDDDAWNGIPDDVGQPTANATRNTQNEGGNPVRRTASGQNRRRGPRDDEDLEDVNLALPEDDAPTSLSQFRRRVDDARFPANHVGNHNNDLNRKCRSTNNLSFIHIAVIAMRVITNGTARFPYGTLLHCSASISHHIVARRNLGVVLVPLSYSYNYDTRTIIYGHITPHQRVVIYGADAPILDPGIDAPYYLHTNSKLTIHNSFDIYYRTRHNGSCGTHVTSPGRRHLASSVTITLS